MVKVIEFIIKHKKIFYAALVALLVAACAVLANKNKNLREDNNRLENNQTALLSDMEEFKTKSGKDAVRIRELELTVGEFKNLCEEQKTTIDDLGIKVKRLQSMHNTGTNTSTGGTAALKDTVIITKIDSIYIKDTYQHFVWSDPWNKIEGTIKDKVVDCHYDGTDTVIVAVSRVPKKFLFFKYGTKYIEVNTVNCNPSTHITYSKAIKIKK